MNKGRTIPSSKHIMQQQRTRTTRSSQTMGLLKQSFTAKISVNAAATSDLGHHLTSKRDFSSSHSTADADGVLDESDETMPTLMTRESEAPSTRFEASRDEGAGRISRRYVPKSSNRRASLGKMRSSSSIFSSFRRKSSSASEHQHQESSVTKRPSRNLSSVSNISGITYPEGRGSFSTAGGDGSCRVNDILREIEDDNNYKKSLQEQAPPSPSSVSERADLSVPEDAREVSQDSPALPAPPAGLRRPSRRLTVESSGASSLDSWCGEGNDLDHQTGGASNNRFQHMDSQTMLAELGPSPTSADLANVAAKRASEYINECLFNGNDSTLDREKWESIPQYSKSELMVRKHLGKGSFSDAFEVGVMVVVEDDTETKKLDTSDKDDLDRLLERKFKGSFNNGSFKGGENESMANDESNTSKDDLDREIEAMFGVPQETPKEETPSPPASASRPREVKFEEPKSSQTSPRPPNTAHRRLRARRQTFDHGDSRPSLRSSVCVGSLANSSDKASTQLARPVRRKQVTYAMKCLRPQIRSNAEQFIVGVEDLVHETAMLASLDHPNIIKIYGRAGCGIGGTSGLRLSDGYFILLDRLKDTLDDRIARWKSSQNGGAVVPSMSQVKTAHCIADALSYLHSRNIIFRDLKPANVGFDSSGTLKLFDFGFATGLDDGADEEGLLHDICGTPRYMAPEVDLGRGYSLPADVHSFGILLWEICSLKKPFAKVKTHEEFRAKVYQRGGRPKLSRHWPAALRETMASCWGSFPGERPAMSAVKTILGAYVREMQQNNGGGSDLRKSSVFRRLTG